MCAYSLSQPRTTLITTNVASLFRPMCHTDSIIRLLHDGIQLSADGSRNLSRVLRPHLPSDKRLRHGRMHLTKSPSLANQTSLEEIWYGDEWELRLAMGLYKILKCYFCAIIRDMLLLFKDAFNSSDYITSNVGIINE